MPAMRVTERLVNHMSSPLGIDDVFPGFSWILESGERHQSQTAYRILVSADPAALADGHGDAWDSGIVATSRSVAVRYAGLPLEPRVRYHWKVRAWDAHGRPTPWSRAAWFELGLLRSGDWRAEWISGAGAGAQDVMRFRKEFSLREPATRARIYSTALGIYQLEVNGEPVSGDRLAPGWTDYRKRIQYQAYDVSALMRPGANVIGAVLAPGWYAGRIGTAGRSLYGRHPALLVQLEVTCADGRSLCVATDRSWRSSAGPVVSADLLDGEVYDARLETPGWSRPGFSDLGWIRATRHECPEGTLVAQAGPPVRVVRELKPVAVSSPRPGVRVFDLGQNMVGTVRLKIRRGEAGVRVTVRYGEVLDRDGMVYTANLRTARATDQYICKGRAEEVYEPLFTVHGFRHVEVTAEERLFGPDTVTGKVLSMDAPQTGTFVTSSTEINRLQENIVWSQRGNFLSIPTDCPQRDERLGWTGDVSVFAATAVFNMDCSRFLGAKWLADLRDAQLDDGAVPDTAPRVPGIGAGNAGWGDAIVTVPYVIWQTYGDERTIVENFDAMMRWMGYLTAHSHGYLRPAAGWGDWQPAADRTPLDLVGTACFARSATLVARMATAVGRHAEAEQMRELAGRVRSAFVDAYVAKDGSLAGDTQAGYALALSFGLLPPPLRRKAAAHLARAVRAHGWRLTTGFLATPESLPSLSGNGHLDAAYRLLGRQDCPSWRYQIERGATTVWEHWDSVTPDGSPRDPSMNSFNHYANGAIGDWMYRNIAGINNDPGSPGYAHIVIRPRPRGGFTSAAATFNSVHGTIECSWNFRGGKFTMMLRIPVNVTAAVYIPAHDEKQVTEGRRSASSAEGVEFVRCENESALFSVGSGCYYFEA
jgi:alpha-L-rhamnosidase